ncbi:hypothetical protein HH214_09155 [Mucilaginibacter robiniae]|uniref:Uncharacterized protein n=1 Tax=Mucilaginibacter robiniae TaxID=2728022 RepID=A0A7L5DZ03_9SPHI|nr:hypothetical protein [Mucilaginibacter robiniae]QJD96031.1 hypothetical protein HH214_09155 [Mucilaginibacter robiniae]
MPHSCAPAGNMGLADAGARKKGSASGSVPLTLGSGAGEGGRQAYAAGGKTGAAGNGVHKALVFTDRKASGIQAACVTCCP